MLNWIMGIAGAFGIGWVALAILAPSVLSVIAEYLKALSPLVRAVADGMVEFFKILYEGLKDVADNFSTIVFVCVLCVISYFYGLTSQPPRLISGPVEVIREYRNKPSTQSKKRRTPSKKEAKKDSSWKDKVFN